MCDLKLFSQVNHITLEEPNKWTLIYVPDESLTIVRDSRPYVNSCGDVGTYRYDDLDNVSKNKLRAIMAHALEFHTDPGATGGYILRDISTGRKAVVKYNNSIRKMTKLNTSPRILDKLHGVASEITLQSIYDDKFTK